MPTKPSLLPLIVFAQFAGTSVWFAGNAVADQMAGTMQAVGSLVAVVQLGFIAGTLTFAIFRLADRFSAHRLFCFSSVCAAAANAAIVIHSGVTMLLLLRFLTGFFLAGIYPIGMKIAAERFPQKLGGALGFLVGALVLGTAFPQLVKWQLHDVEWKAVIWCTSALALLGGLLVLAFVPPSPKQKSTAAFRPLAALQLFSQPRFRAAAFGYFGHMWELYAFWAFVPAILELHNRQSGSGLAVMPWSFVVIAAGSLGCILGGLLSRRIGSRKVAAASLAASGLCCFVLPWLMPSANVIFPVVLLLWGLTVVSDSPQLSALVAAAAPNENRGTALTTVTCVGFAITIISIQLAGLLLRHFDGYGLWVLAAGPLWGWRQLRKA